MTIQDRVIAYLGASLMIMACLWGGITAVALADKQETPGAAGSSSASITGPSDLNVIIIDNNGYHENRRGPVKFPHLKHAEDYKISCWQCHHVYKDDKNVYTPWGKTDRCITCHDPLKKQENAMMLQTSYHLSCKKCHEAMKIYKDNPEDYRKCTTCHEKKQG